MRVDSSIVATVIAGFAFVGLWVMALVSLVKSDGQMPDKPGRRNKPRRKKRWSPASAQRRGSRSRKRDRVKPLPADATVTFAAERKAADVDEVFEALDNDLIGLVPVKKKVQEIAAQLLVDRAMGGIPFIDEAYYLYRIGDTLDYGQEAIEILLQVMENDRDKLVVILAGYKDRMGEFFTSNPGMSSRIAHHLDFAAYELDELSAIGRLMLEQSRYYLSEDAEEAFRQYLAGQMDQPMFATRAASATNSSVPGSGTPTALLPTCTATGPR